MRDGPGEGIPALGQREVEHHAHIDDRDDPHDAQHPPAKPDSRLLEIHAPNLEKTAPAPTKERYDREPEAARLNEPSGDL